MNKIKTSLSITYTLFFLIALVLVLSSALIMTSPRAMGATESEQCTSTGGEVAYNGTELSCICPADTVLTGSGCENSSSTGTNPSRPGSTSNNCLSMSDAEKAKLKLGDPCYQLKTVETFDEGENDVCGKGKNTVSLSVNIGCIGEEYPEDEFNPIVDMLFAFFRFLSAGVGIIVIGSIIVAGIQYSASRGNPQATEAALKRISGSFVALVIYVLIYAIANFLVPGGMF